MLWNGQCLAKSHEILLTYFTQQIENIVKTLQTNNICSVHLFHLEIFPCVKLYKRKDC